jgi:hypothetical protein
MASTSAARWLETHRARVAAHTAEQPKGSADLRANGWRRRGRVFSLRLSPEDESALEALKAEHEKQLVYQGWGAPYGYERGRGLGSFIVWAARQFKPGHVKKAEPSAQAVRNSARATTPARR